MHGPARSPHSRRIDMTLWPQHGHFSIDKKYLQNARSLPPTSFLLLLEARPDGYYIVLRINSIMKICICVYYYTKAGKKKPVICLHHQALYAEDIQIPGLS